VARSVSFQRYLSLAHGQVFFVLYKNDVLWRLCIL